jgi:hypothetical protein
MCVCRYGLTDRQTDKWSEVIRDVTSMYICIHVCMSVWSALMRDGTNSSIYTTNIMQLAEEELEEEVRRDNYACMHMCICLYYIYIYIYIYIRKTNVRSISSLL